MLYALKIVQVMIPAKTTCPPTWTVVYDGYLMTEHYNNNSNKDYICIEYDGDPILGNAGNINGASLYHVIATCTRVPCPPYTTNMYIACVVCTK